MLAARLSTRLVALRWLCGAGPQNCWRLGAAGALRDQGEGESSHCPLWCPHPLFISSEDVKASPSTLLTFLLLRALFSERYVLFPPRPSPESSHSNHPRRGPRCHGADTEHSRCDVSEFLSPRIVSYDESRGTL